MLAQSFQATATQCRLEKVKAEEAHDSVKDQLQVAQNTLSTAEAMFAKVSNDLSDVREKITRIPSSRTGRVDEQEVAKSHDHRR